MIKQNKRQEFMPGIIAVIHTFGRILKWNPHVHMIVTEGGKGKFIEWKYIRHFSYEALRKRWQKILLDEITNICGNSKQIKSLKINYILKKIMGFMFMQKVK